MHRIRKHHHHYQQQQCYRQRQRCGPHPIWFWTNGTILLLSLSLVTTARSLEQDRRMEQPLPSARNLSSSNLFKLNPPKVYENENDGESLEGGSSSETATTKPSRKRPISVWDNRPVCPTGELRTYEINTLTGTWRVVEEENNDNHKEENQENADEDYSDEEDEDDDYSRDFARTNATDPFDIYLDTDVDFDDTDTNATIDSDTYIDITTSRSGSGWKDPPQRMLRRTSRGRSRSFLFGDSDALEEVAVVAEPRPPPGSVSRSMTTSHNHHHRRTAASTEGSSKDNLSPTADFEIGDGAIIRVQARPCICFGLQDDGEDGGSDNLSGRTTTGSSNEIGATNDDSISIEENTHEFLCPAISNWCFLERKTTIGTTELRRSGGAAGADWNARCFAVGKHDAIAKNMWPLLWMWYSTILVAICCTFQGRVVLDFVRGTILYYFCGCGDRFRNRSMRNIDRYNAAIVDEILEEERRLDGEGDDNNHRSDGRRNSSDDGDFDDRPRGIPASIVTAPSVPVGAGGAYGGGNSHGDHDGDERTTANNRDAEEQQPPRLLRMAWVGWNRLTEKFGNILWPWQTSWKRYIKYNLLLRVEWITLRDEVAFIESRQQRGLPHALYEMKTRVWRDPSKTHGGDDDEENLQPPSDAAGDESNNNNGNNNDDCMCPIASSNRNSNTDGSGCFCGNGDGGGGPPSIGQNSLDEPHCTICFSELEDGDRVGDLGCNHVFHVDCLKMWVTKRNSCPLCSIPIARRKRISSDELDETDKDLLRSLQPTGTHRNGDDETRGIESSGRSRGTAIGRRNEPSTPQTTAVSSSNSDIVAATVAGVAMSDEYDHTRPPPGYGSPSYNATLRREPRVLLPTRTPMTPSTVAMDTYSNYSDDLDLPLEVDDAETSNPTPNAGRSIDINDFLSRGFASERNEVSSQAPPPVVAPATPPLPSSLDLFGQFEQEEPTGRIRMTDHRTRADFDLDADHDVNDMPLATAPDPGR